MRGQWWPPSRELHRRVFPASGTENFAWPDTSAAWTASAASSPATLPRPLRASDTTSYRGCAGSPPAKPHFPEVSAAARGLRAPREHGPHGVGRRDTHGERRRRRPRLGASLPAPRGAVSLVACESEDGAFPRRGCGRKAFGRSHVGAARTWAALAGPGRELASLGHGLCDVPKYLNT